MFFLGWFDALFVQRPHKEWENVFAFGLNWASFHMDSNGAFFHMDWMATRSSCN